MKPARALLWLTFAVPLICTCLFLYIILQLSSFMHPWWQIPAIADDTLGRLVQHKAQHACREMIPIVIAPVIAAILVSYLDVSQWKTGLGKMTIGCLAAFFISLAIFMGPMLVCAIGR